VTAPVTSSMVGGDQNTTLYSSSSSISLGPGVPATTSSQSPSSPSRRSARDSQYAAAATAEGGGGELARRGRPPATGRGRGDAAEVEAPALAPSPDEEEEERTARLVRRRRCLPGGFLIAGREQMSSGSRSPRSPAPRALSNHLLLSDGMDKIGLSKKKDLGPLEL
jgi:hypothetical protein